MDNSNISFRYRPEFFTFLSTLPRLVQYSAAATDGVSDGLGGSTTSFQLSVVGRCRARGSRCEWNDADSLGETCLWGLLVYSLDCRVNVLVGPLVVTEGWLTVVVESIAPVSRKGFLWNPFIPGVTLKKEAGHLGPVFPQQINLPLI